MMLGPVIMLYMEGNRGVLMGFQCKNRVSVIELDLNLHPLFISGRVHYGKIDVIDSKDNASYTNTSYVNGGFCHAILTWFLPCMFCGHERVAQIFPLSISAVSIDIVMDFLISITTPASASWRGRVERWRTSGGRGGWASCKQLRPVITDVEASSTLTMTQWSNRKVRTNKILPPPAPALSS